MKTKGILKQYLIERGKAWSRFFRRIFCIHDWEVTDLNPKEWDKFPNGEFNSEGIPNIPEGPPVKIVTPGGPVDPMQIDCNKCGTSTFIERKHVPNLFAGKPGYQPVFNTLNPTDPPQGGSGVSNKKPKLEQHWVRYS